MVTLVDIYYICDLVILADLIDLVGDCRINYIRDINADSGILAITINYKRSHITRGALLALGLRNESLNLQADQAQLLVE